MIITATPELASLRNTKNLVDMLKLARPNDKPPWLVLNQVGVPKRSEINPAQFAKALEIEPISCIAFDPATFSAAANDGRMISDKGAGAAAVRHFGQIADKISGRILVSHKRTDRFGIKRLWGL